MFFKSDILQIYFLGEETIFHFNRFWFIFTGKAIPFVTWLAFCANRERDRKREREMQFYMHRIEICLFARSKSG